MSNVICKKCGETGCSKCPYCRNVFPDNFSIDMLNTSLLVKLRNRESGGQKLVIEFHHPIVNEGETPEDVALVYIEQFRQFSVTDLKKILCNHRWEFDEGCESTIGCGHKNG